MWWSSGSCSNQIESQNGFSYSIFWHVPAGHRWQEQNSSMEWIFQITWVIFSLGHLQANLDMFNYSLLEKPTHQSILFHSDAVTITMSSARGHFILYLCHSPQTPFPIILCLDSWNLIISSQLSHIKRTIKIAHTHTQRCLSLACNISLYPCFLALPLCFWSWTVCLVFECFCCLPWPLPVCGLLFRLCLTFACLWITLSPLPCIIWPLPVFGLLFCLCLALYDICLFLDYSFVFALHYMTFACLWITLLPLPCIIWPLPVFGLLFCLCLALYDICLFVDYSFASALHYMTFACFWITLSPLPCIIWPLPVFGFIFFLCLALYDLCLFLDLSFVFALHYMTFACFWITLLSLPWMILFAGVRPCLSDYVLNKACIWIHTSLVTSPSDYRCSPDVIQKNILVQF